MTELTHFDESGASRMVDVTGKEVTLRTARASGRVRLAAVDAGPGRGSPAGQGRRAGGGSAGRDHGGQAHRRADSALPPAGAGQRRARARRRSSRT